jgi:hypothetical protein
MTNESSWRPAERCKLEPKAYKVSPSLLRQTPATRNRTGSNNGYAWRTDDGPIPAESIAAARRALRRNGNRDLSSEVISAAFNAAVVASGGFPDITD